MKRGGRTLGYFFPVWLVCLVAVTAAGEAEPQAMDLPALAKKARPAAFLLIAYDANGKKIATGTGFLVSGDGRLVTNHHVIAEAHKMIAKAENGGQFLIGGILATHTIASEDAIFSDPDHRAAVAAKEKKAFATMLKHARTLVEKCTGHHDAAIAAFRQAIKLKPDDAFAWNDLGGTYRDAGNAAETQTAFQKARELNPSLFK